MKNINDICLWKLTNEENTKLESTKYLVKKRCLECDGYNINCDAYLKKPEWYENEWMVKGSEHTSAQKHGRTYGFKKRCSVKGCKKRAREIINKKSYCKVHLRDIYNE